MKGWYVNDDKLERMRNEAVVAYFKHYLGICLEGMKKQRQTAVRIAGLRAEIWTRDVPNT
jgi:hypothetical protein